MTILNDNQIRKLCLTPTHVFRKNDWFFSKQGDDWYSLTDGGLYIHPHTGEVVDKLTETEINNYRRPMIFPFEPNQIKERERNGTIEKIVSYGTSSMGYDVRLGRNFKIFTNLFSAIIDPLDMPPHSYVDHEGDFVIIPPNSYVLGHTIEYFDMPRDVTAICVGKSTYARAGCGINVTPIEPGFCGQVVIEICNYTPLPLKVHAGMGIAQFLFLQGNECGTSYADRAGKYQGQTGIQTAIV